MTHLYTLMKKRRSIRHFSTRSVSKETLQKIVKAGFYAPSGANVHPYVYIVVDDQALQQKIRDVCEEVDKTFFTKADPWFQSWMKQKEISLEKGFLTDAPILIVVAGDTTKPYWLESTWISMGYLILAAEQEQVATLTYTPADTKDLNHLMDVPANFQIVAVIPLGHATKTVKKKEVQPVKNHVFMNRYYIDFFQHNR